jgi:hypothetical protein
MLHQSLSCMKTKPERPDDAASSLPIGDWRLLGLDLA